jgi:glycine/D-amino acid oxidase-like deaminating enzyme
MGIFMKDYASYSFWLETSGDDLTARPQLDGSIDADIAILGAGYSGLWTAYYLLQREPGLRIVLLEAEIAGFGASGRNGGWCSSGFPVSLGELARRYGKQVTRELHAAMCDAVDEVGRASRREGLTIDYTKGGNLDIARGEHQLPAIREAYETRQRLGLAEQVRMLDARETGQRIRISKARGSLFDSECAAIHPGKLVRGLARLVEMRGATIFEQSEVTDFRVGRAPLLRTRRAEVRAQTIVLAGEAYLSRRQQLHRQITPIYSLIVLTEPLTASQWEDIGWQGRECVSSPRYTVDYLQRTADGRILFGSRGAPYHLASGISDEYDRHEPTHQMIRDLIIEWFPMLRDVGFSHSWGGAVGMPRDWMPTVSFDAGEGVATARGYTGQGVATTNLAGRILADLILGVQSPITRLPVVNHRSPNWEPEPLRWLAIRGMQWAYGYIDRRAERTGKPPSGRSLPERLGRH